MSTGKINVSVENIFPLIKKFLYSDHEIFLRELVSNATDATLKLKHLTSIGEAKVEYGNPMIEVKIDFITTPRLGQTYKHIQSLIKRKLDELTDEIEGDYYHTQFLIQQNFKGEE